jgi:hypothetical protein
MVGFLGLAVRQSAQEEILGRPFLQLLSGFPPRPKNRFRSRLGDIANELLRSGKGLAPHHLPIRLAEIAYDILDDPVDGFVLQDKPSKVYQNHRLME